MTKTAATLGLSLSAAAGLEAAADAVWRRYRAQVADDIEQHQNVFAKLPVKLTERGLILENAEPEVLPVPKRLPTRQ
ncbi:hypothetical protein [Rhizobium leguminosarum]|uniref:hypothetical protein n=1 Tax=Rhizobium leguminosarum TaxID=384 RepID=UPI001C90223D|nr:hypothetical protein [Rhizobium leguminosarum]MBY3026138.1 hypothetical protein [Rhizobium leguminosarum]